MTREEVRRLLDGVSERWLADPEADVVWVGDYEGRRGVRVRLGTGDPNTVWFEVGERTLRVGGCILAAPPAARREEVYRRCLAANTAGRRLHLALDRRGDLVLLGRVPLDEADAAELDLLLGEAHEALEVVCPSLGRSRSGAKTSPERLVDKACAQTPVDGGGYVDRSAALHRLASGTGT